MSLHTFLRLSRLNFKPFTPKHLRQAARMADPQYKFLPRPDNAQTMSPSEARALFRKNRYYGGTSGFCKGYDQANVLILPEHLADDFEEFCKRNSAPFPLLYRSRSGEAEAPPLAENSVSDIKTDLPRYNIYSHGRAIEDALDLGAFEQSWSDRVSFYLGCSYTFEHVLAANGIQLANMRERKNASIYNSSIQLSKVNSFGGRMVVTMRPIAKEQLSLAFQLSAAYPHHHGAPIHIGDPAQIGIDDIMKPEYGDPQVVPLTQNQITTFWACGVSLKEAVTTSKPALAFSHYPGSMFITDVESKPHQSPSVEICQLSRDGDPYFASVIEESAKDLFLRLEDIILDDQGGRGVRDLYEPLDLMKSALALSHSYKVAVTTGFPANTDFPVKEETDGFPGALSICQAVLALGKEVTLVCDQSTQSLYESCVEYGVSIGALKAKVPVISVAKAKDLYDSCSKQSPPFDCLVAIERAGRAKDGTYRTMGATDVSKFVDHDPALDDLFVAAGTNPLVKTVCIGDGGNELGMGKVYSKVVKHINKGSEIACATSADFVIAAGVSNWGGCALSLGLYLVSTSPTHWRYRNHGVNAERPPPFRVSDFLPTAEQTTSLLKHMNSLGIRDGITKGLGQTVDGLELHKHLEKLREIVEVINP